jgi:hypothetical protein
MSELYSDIFLSVLVEFSWGIKGSRNIRLSQLCRENVGASASHNSVGLHVACYRDSFFKDNLTFFITKQIVISLESC